METHRQETSITLTPLVRTSATVDTNLECVTMLLITGLEILILILKETIMTNPLPATCLFGLLMFLFLIPRKNASGTFTLAIPSIPEKPESLLITTNSLITAKICMNYILGHSTQLLLRWKLPFPLLTLNIGG